MHLLSHTPCILVCGALALEVILCQGLPISLSALENCPDVTTDMELVASGRVLPGFALPSGNILET